MLSAYLLCQSHFLQVPALSKKFIIKDREINDIFPHGGDLTSFVVEIDLFIVV